ncbi:MAG: hypothetical protein V9F00_04745 [Nocardioides sp.]
MTHRIWEFYPTYNHPGLPYRRGVVVGAFGVSLYASSAQSRDAAAAKLLRWRSAEEWKGVRAP